MKKLTLSMTILGLISLFGGVALAQEDAPTGIYATTDFGGDGSLNGKILVCDGPTAEANETWCRFFELRGLVYSNNGNIYWDNEIWNVQIGADGKKRYSARLGFNRIEGKLIPIIPLGSKLQVTAKKSWGIVWETLDANARVEIPVLRSNIKTKVTIYNDMGDVVDSAVSTQGTYQFQ